MKKTIAYTLLAVMILTMAAGCGRMGEETPPATPRATAAPVMPSPDPDAGIVKDKDGIITPEDSGSATSPRPTAGTTPESGSEQTPGAASPSPSTEPMQKNK